MMGEVGWGKVGVSLHHVQCYPAPQVLQNHERRASLHMPAGPGVPKVMKVEVVDANFGASTAKTARIDLTNLADDAIPAFRRRTSSPGQVALASGTLTDRGIVSWLTLAADRGVEQAGRPLLRSERRWNEQSVRGAQYELRRAIT